MATSDVQWLRVQRPIAEAPALESLVLPDAATVELELPNLKDYDTPVKKARWLLETGAEVEHALLAQYLYAAFSLKDREEMAEPAQGNAVHNWRQACLTIAKEEMGHLMTVQNLLLVIRQPLNFEREDFPPNKLLYPFTLHLEPMTQFSLAKYVVAESPDNPGAVEDIIQQATGAAGATINRVGVLYGILGVLFSSPELLEQNAATGDKWYMMVREMAGLLRQTFPKVPPEGWHLPEDAFDPQSIGRQATAQLWGSGNIRVFTAQTRQECLTALRDIAIQGEGTMQPAPGSPEQSHFDRFLLMYRGAGSLPPFPATGEWLPTRDVPTDPKIAADPNSAGPNDISAPETIPWAKLADAHYELLLGLLEQFFHEPPNDREWVPYWCLPAMYHITLLSDVLTRKGRRTGSTAVAAFPFTMPEVLHLPADPAQRRALHLARVQKCLALVEQLLVQNPGDLLLGDMKTQGEPLLARFSGGPVTPPPDPTGPEQAMRELLTRRRGIAQAVHREVSAGNTTLGQLFRDQNYDDILAFLRSGVSAREPFAGRKLVEPGKPDESALYLQMTAPDGVMAGILAQVETDVVKAWIASLASPPPTPPAPPAGPDPRQEMLALVKSKRAIGQVMHGGVEVGNKSLSELFAAERYEDILQFLETAAATRDPFTGKKLIEPGKPEESGFFLHITDPNGVMVGKFTPSQVEVVKRWILSLGTGAHEVTEPASSGARVSAKPLVSGLTNPVFVTAPPGNQKQLFIVEQTGAIKILDLATNQVKPQGFLQVAGLSTTGERGLLGLAFHPQYAENGLFYVNCTNAQGDTEIRRYNRSEANADQADPNSQQLVLKIGQPFANHNGGWLAFGPRDGFLYITTGDGGSANDPQNRAQNRNLLLGKILRIDIDRDDFPQDPNRNYGIPPSNPFVGQVGVREEIWAYGLRNPWRCSFDRSTGDLYIGDVGQNQREEIDFQASSSLGGENYGWRLKEGTRVTGLGDLTGMTLVDPIHEYGRGEGSAVVGGYVYRGKAASLQGTYFCGDFGSGRVWSFRYENGQQKDFTERTQELTGGGVSLEALSSFGEDDAGEMYLTTILGDLFRLEAAPAPAAAALEATPFANIARVKIHPAIGVARMGNAGFVNGVPATPASATDYFIGPESPFQTGPPPGGYKRAGRVRRQAARFRLYAYDANDQLLGEITNADAEITWTVELANTKASWMRFEGLDPTTPLRNPHMQGAMRQQLEIRPGPRTLTGPNQAAAFNSGSFTDLKNNEPRTVSNIYLGGIKTEDTGRLVVLGGEGTAASPWNKPVSDFANNNGWYDTSSDGPVQATVRLRFNNQSVPVLGAWVICPPPKFAPDLRNIVTLYDTLRQVAIEKGLLPSPGQPSFKQDIYPILQRAINMKWLHALAGNIHDSVTSAFPPAGQAVRNGVFRRLRSPHKGQGQNGPQKNMPILFDDTNRWLPVGDPGLAVTKTMYAQLTQWRDGNFTNDWDGSPPQPSLEITPDGLTQAALENCAGGGFYPGIEASWMLRDVFDWLEPFRINPINRKAGDVTKQMAIPWQADFLKCTSGGELIAWWPQQRPDEVFPEVGDQQLDWIRDKVVTHMDMVQRWHELGFVVWNGTRYVETDRNPN